MAKTYDTYKDSGIAWIGEIPGEWEVCRYKVFTTNRMGETILASETSESGIPIYSATQDNTIFGHIKSPKVLLHKGDIVIPARGNSIGFAKLVKEDVATCSQTTICSTNIFGINNKFLYHCIYGLKDFWFRYDGSAIPQITVDQVKNNKVPVPSAPEQEAIAFYLDQKCSEIDSLIFLQEEMISELQAYKQSVITEAVTKGLDKKAKMKNSGVEWIGDIPEEWEVQKLRTLGWCQNGISKSGDYFGEDYEYPFVSYPDAYKNFEVPYPKGRANSTLEDRQRYSLVKGDVLFTRTSETIEEIGFASTCTETIPNAVFSGFLIRFRPTSHKIYYGYSKYFFRSVIHRAFFVKEMNLVTRASLSQDLLKNLPVVLPKIEEQQAIATYLDEKTSQIDSLIALKQSKIESLKEYKKSIIYEYVTGKKRV